MAKNKFTKFWNLETDPRNSKVLNMYVYGQIKSSSHWLFGSDTDVVTNTFIKDLRNHPDAETINVYINSPGGEVFAAAAIRNQLRAHKAKVHTFIDGIAASAATVIALAGDEISMSRASLMMIHNPLTGVQGNAAELQKAIELLNKVKGTIVSVYKEKSNLSEDEISDLMDKEEWMNADEALEKGFIDKITEDEDTEMIMDDANDAFMFKGVSFTFTNFANPEAFKAKLNSMANLKMTTKMKEDEKPMKFEEIMNSLSEDQRAVVLAHITSAINAAVEAEKVTNTATVTQLQNDITSLKDKLSAQNAAQEDPETAILASMPEEAKTIFLAAKAAAATATAALEAQQEQQKFDNFKAGLTCFDSLPLEDTHVKAMYTLSNADATQFEALKSVLTIANNAMAAGFNSLGTDGPATNAVGDGAYASIEAKVKDKMKNDPTMEYSDAFRAVITENPALYEEYRNERI